jgi:hypothetical protein
MYIGVQHLSGDGHVAPGWPAVGTPVVALDPWPWQTLVDPNEVPRVVANGSDGVFIAWQSYFLPQFRWGGTVTGPIYVQSIAPDGTRRWGDQGLLVCAAPGVHSSPEIVPDGHGGAFVFWCDQRPPDPMGRVFGQHVTDSGKISWARDGIPVSRAYRLRFIEKPQRVLVLAPPFAIADGSRGAIVSWSGSRGTDFDVFAARVTHGGGLPWKGDSQVCRASGDQFDMRMVPLSGGGAIIGWLDSRPAGTQVAAQRLTHGGRVVWRSDGVAVGAAQVVAPYWSVRGLLAMAVDGADGAFFAWPDVRPQGELFAMRFTGEGQPAGGWPAGGAALSRRAEALSTADMAYVGNGNAIVAWQQGGAAWVTLLAPDGPAATPGPSPIAWSKRGAQPGQSDSKTSLSRSLRLSPGRSRDRLILSLADASPASLEFFDVAGRKIWSREVGDLGAGEHEVELDNGARLPTGLYLARLTQEGDRATTRIAVTH